MVKIVSAQSEAAVVIGQIIESVADDLGEDYDYSELADRLSYYSQNPIDLNKTNGDELKELMFINQLQINNLLDYRLKNGPFADLLELQAVEGIDAEMAAQLSAFVFINKNNPLRNINAGAAIRDGHHDLMLRYGRVLQKQVGFKVGDSSKSHYLGTPGNMFVRYRYSYGRHVFASLNMEKDAGENLFSGAQSRGFDFYSSNLFLKDVGKFRKILVGDYGLQFGQGLALWAGLGFGKGATVASVAKSEIGLRPYSSSNEALFFRGVAATIDLNRISITPFFSYRKLDAGIDTSLAGEEIKSWNQTGFHRTATEITNRSNLKQMLYGTNIQYIVRNFNIGLTGYKTDFDHPFALPENEYSKFQFSGSSLVNLGAYYNRTWRNMYFFGELAHSVGSGSSLLNGVLASLSSRVSAVLIYRDYQRNYQSFYSRAIAEGSDGANERGFYSGITLTPAKNFEWATYADFFRFPWLKYRVDAPSSGFEIYSQLTYTIKNKLRGLLRYKREEKEQNGEAHTTVNALQTVQKQNYRAELIYFVSKSFQVRNRLEISQYRKGKDEPAAFGYLLYQDLIYNPIQSKLSGNIRFAIFDTPDYDTRVYAYENDVLYGYSIPAFQNSGTRFYVNICYRLARGIDVWAKYGVTDYTNKEEVGSGLDVIKGHVRSDAKVQLRFQL